MDFKLPISIQELEKNIQALLSQAEEELNYIVSNQRMHLDADLKVRVSVFSFLLCSALDHLWNGITSSSYDQFPIIIVDEKERKYKEKMKAIEELSPELSSIIQNVQPFKVENEREKWLQHLKYLRNFNTHHQLSGGNQSIEFSLDQNFSPRKCLNISYWEKEKGITTIKDADIFLKYCFSETKNLIYEIGKYSGFMKLK